MSVFILILAIALWGTIHSILASNFAKDMAGGTNIYRLGFNLFAGASFVPILYLMVTLPDQAVYRVPQPWNIIMSIGQGVAALLLLISLLQTDLLAFIGLRQLVESQKPAQLVTRGLYRVVRHPLYLFSLLFLWLTPAMSQNYLSVYLGLTLYTLIGVYFEEQKLLREYGEGYAEYKRRTPMLIPGLLLGRK